MGYLSLARLITFGTSLLFSIIVLGIAADVISTEEKYLDEYSNFAALAVATAVLTLATVGPMLIIDILRRGAFSSWIVVELGWLSILWVLWLATGADAANTDGNTFIGSSCNFENSIVSRVCNEFKAIEAFSFLTWIILMAYTVLLLVLAIRGQNAGHSVWKSSVRDGAFLEPAVHKDVDLSQSAYPQQTAGTHQQPVSMPVPHTSPVVQV
ncbi:hypothetical protein FA95DRAFT_1291395 [Auriscalpium vulgare]|uniref:Uncharacterized protein n=1 Tax=Auriscalpium vulgare TaxID=40419 RepID=A0ACB8RTM9_9AGAM|nr:hypothetical protein FA95DRAFT_1291395 [Auriscalpium vulgare]